jgi:hypothetical protein
MFNRTNSTICIAPSGLEALRAERPRHRRTKNPKSEARNPKQIQNLKSLMLKTFNKRSDISCKQEKPNHEDTPADAFVLHFCHSKLFRISDFEFRIFNFTYTWRPLRESSFIRFRKRKFKGKFQTRLVRIQRTHGFALVTFHG